MKIASKEKIVTAITFALLIGALIAGIYFIVRLVNGPAGGEKTRDAIMSGELKTYTHPDYGFTINYPAGFKLGKFPEGEGEVILVQGEDGKQGLQIFVSLYEEENALSKAKIEEAAPSMQITNDKEIELGQDKIKAISFETSGTGSGDTQEIWFVADGNLYQVTSYKEFGLSLIHI